MDSNLLFHPARPQANPADYSSEIREAINELRQITGENALEVVVWNDDYIGVAFCLDVDLPTRGPVGGVDLREQEPTLLLLHKHWYPFVAPQVRSDRKDFPNSQLPHLNPVPTGEPAYICLYRGNINDWFAEHSLSDFVSLIRRWFRDAGMNRLIGLGDEFEPTRMQEMQGLCIYDPLIFTKIIQSNWRRNSGQASCAILPFDLLRDDPLFIHLGSERPHLSWETKLREYLSKPSNLPIAYGLLLWSEEQSVCSEYFGYLPRSLHELHHLADKLGLYLKSNLTKYLGRGLHVASSTNTIPITLAIQRPSRLIGSKSNIELLNLALRTESKYSFIKQLPDDSDVIGLGHLSPLTVELARDVSSITTSTHEPPVMLLGCGAIGSKLALHLARAGYTSLILVDNDQMWSHNFVRHGLSSTGLGQNKATAVKEVIDSMYREDTANVAVKALESSAFEVLLGDHHAKLNECSVIIDCTASASVRDALIRIHLPKKLRVVQCGMVHHGKLGFLSIEGTGRNPRLDDLQAQLFDLAIEDDTISDWLKTVRQQQNEMETNPLLPLEEIGIGMGCSSATMRLSDDLVSYHVSSFALGLRNLILKNADHQAAGVQISYFDNVSPTPGGVRFSVCHRVRVLQPGNGSPWQIRVKASLWEELIANTKAASPNETGGLFVGYCDRKRKIIYVTRVVPPPPDSISYPYAFVLGIEDVPETILKIHNRTGGFLGYVGEWHSHPTGGSKPSQADLSAVNQIKSNLDSIGIPTHIMIVTLKHCHSYIF